MVLDFFACHSDAGSYKPGNGMYWDTYEKQRFNPKTGQAGTAIRRGLKVDMELPLREAYTAFIANVLNC